MRKLASAIMIAALLPVGTAAALPPGDPPNVTPPGGFVGPPAAWIETANGDHWLYPADWQWCPPDRGGLCTMEPQAALAPTDVCQLQVFGYQQEAAVSPGERVRIHLAFAPETATLAFGDLIEPFTPAQDLPWAVTGASGGLVLRMTVGRSVVDYRVRLVVGSDSARPTAKVLGVARKNRRVFLRIRTSEPVSSSGCLTGNRPSNAETRRLFSSHRRLRLPPERVGRDVQLIPIGRLPNGTFSLRVRLRDQTGNTTTLELSDHAGHRSGRRSENDVREGRSWRARQPRFGPLRAREEPPVTPPRSATEMD